MPFRFSMAFSQLIVISDFCPAGHYANKKYKYGMSQTQSERRKTRHFKAADL
jgi:hypothetical protein